MFILVYFVVLFILLIVIRNKSVARFLIAIQIVSLSGSFFIGSSYTIDSPFKVFNLALVIIFLTIIILPWMKINNIRHINGINDKKVKRLTYFLLGTSIIPFIVFLVVTTFVLLYVENIDEFKYGEGVSTEFYYNLPIDTKLIIISNYLYNFSYFLIPLHFYYLNKKKFFLSFLCLLFSLNIVLFGLTYFSRSVVVHYILIYLSFLIILYSTLSSKLKRVIKFAVFVFVISFTSYFIYITNERFTSDSGYAELIPAKSMVQDPAIYSYLDYLSQWYPNGMYVLNDYNFQTFKGQTSLQPILSLLGQYGLVSFNNDEYLNLRMRLWPKHWYMFNGLVGYTIYDYGYIGSLIFLVIYVYVVYTNRPRNNQISLLQLFLIILMIQIPLVSIFYSGVGGIIIPLTMLIPISLYLKLKVR